MSVSSDEIMQAIGRLEGTVSAMQQDVEKMGGRIEKIEAAANWGRGALWAAIKVGTFLVAAAGGLAWLWDRLKP